MPSRHFVGRLKGKLCMIHDILSKDKQHKKIGCYMLTCLPRWCSWFLSLLFPHTSARWVESFIVRTKAES